MENSKDHKAAAEPPLDCRVGRDVVAMLRERAARKWTDDANRSASLFGQAADEIERLRNLLQNVLADAQAQDVLFEWWHLLECDTVPNV